MKTTTILGAFLTAALLLPACGGNSLPHLVLHVDGVRTPELKIDPEVPVTFQVFKENSATGVPVTMERLILEGPLAGTEESIQLPGQGMKVPFEPGLYRVSFISKDSSAVTLEFDRLRVKKAAIVAQVTSTVFEHEDGVKVSLETVDGGNAIQSFTAELRRAEEQPLSSQETTTGEVAFQLGGQVPAGEYELWVTPTAGPHKQVTAPVTCLVSTGGVEMAVALNLSPSTRREVGDQLTLSADDYIGEWDFKDWDSVQVFVAHKASGTNWTFKLEQTPRVIDLLAEGEYTVTTTAKKVGFDLVITNQKLIVVEP